MELPQSRPFGPDQAGSKSTHDFLSLYPHPSPQQDPRPSPQDGYLKTHNFLQPQEPKRKASTEEETDAERPPPPAPPPSVVHLLPGGIGSYSVCPVPYFDHRVQLKPEASVFTCSRSSSSVERTNENSNDTSFTAAGSRFILREERAVKKGKTGKENIVGERPHEGGASTGQWTASMERPSPSTPNNQPIGKKNQSFMEMLKSAKSTSQDEELDDDDEFDIKKETSTANKEELRNDVEGNSFDRKASTPRSKHSATEQRRRSKINDRFQMLRDVIPHSDQKRDKASFLLEMVEYIKYLQEKVQKYEGSYQEWNHEVAKLMPLRINQGSADFVEKNAAPSSSVGPGSSHYAVDPDTNCATNLKAVDPYPESINNAERTRDVAVASEMQKEQDLTIEEGTINISSVYSQGLLNTLTHALHSLGLDLSQARISVQIELGKQANRIATAPSSIDKDVDVPINDTRMIDS